MYDPDIHPDPTIGAGVLAEAGIDCRAVREVIADDRAIRCPERPAAFPAYGFAALAPEPAPEPGLHEAAAPWDPASALPPAEWRWRRA